jgi:soluble lytic murein transglycosylase-like protein
MPQIAHSCAQARLLPFRIIVAAIAFAVLMPGTVAQAEARDPYGRYIAEAAQRFAIPERWIREVMRVESAGRPRAVSRAGAMGLMQIMPGTWADLRRAHGLGADPFRPRDNILAGAAYLRQMYDRYRSVRLMLAAYNAGPGRTDQHIRAGRQLPAETRAYLAALVPALSGAQPAELRSPVLLAQTDPATAPLFAVVAQPIATSEAAVVPKESLSPDESRLLSLHRQFDLDARRSRSPSTESREQPNVGPTAPARNAAARSPASALFAVTRPAGSAP